MAERGLTAAEVAERVATGQVNDVPSAPTRTVGQIVRANVLTRFNLLLGVAAGRHPGRRAAPGRPVRARDRGQHVGRHRPGGAGQADPRPARGGQRPPGPGGPRRPGGRARRRPGGARRRARAGRRATRSWSTARCWRRPGWRSTSRCSPASPSRWPKARRRGCSRAASWPPGAAATGRPRSGREAYAVQLTEEARRFTLARSELRAGVDRILKSSTWALIPTAVLLFVSQLRLEHGGPEPGSAGPSPGRWPWSPRGWCC